MYPAELVLTVYLAQYLCRILKPTKYEGGWLLTSPSESSRKSIDCEPPEILVADATNFVLHGGEGPAYYGAAAIEEKQVLTKRSKNRETTGTGTTTDKSKREEK